MSALHNKSSKSRDALTLSLQLVLGIIVGVLICAGWLMQKPVTITDTPPKADRERTDRHEIVYVRGLPGVGKQGDRKHKAFLARTPGEITFTEQDVNRWLTGAYGSKERTFPIKGTGVTLGPRVPAVRLAGDELQIGLEIGVDREGSARTVVVQAHGRFIAKDGRQVFVPRQVYLGSCPLPWNLGGRLLYERIASLYPTTENVNRAWAAVSHAAVVENRMQLVVTRDDVPASNAPAAQTRPAPLPATPVESNAPPAATTVETPAPASSNETPASDVPAETAAPTPQATAPAVNDAVSAAEQEPATPPPQATPDAASPATALPDATAPAL